MGAVLGRKVKEKRKEPWRIPVRVAGKLRLGGLVGGGRPHTKGDWDGLIGGLDDRTTKMVPGPGQIVEIARNTEMTLDVEEREPGAK